MSAKRPSGGLSVSDVIAADRVRLPEPVRPGKVGELARARRRARPRRCCPRRCSAEVELLPICSVPPLISVLPI